MITQINAVDAEWTPDIWAKWHTFVDAADPKLISGTVTRANYFTPRPYRNEYDRGDRKEGFTFVVRKEGGYRQSVQQVIVNGPFMPWICYPQAPT